MRLFYYRATTNFGDHMNSWLWPRLLPGLIEDESDHVLVGIGSLIKSDLSKVPGQKIIFGAGSGYGPMPLPQDRADWRIYFVRGPLTARLLDLPPDKAIVDGAWLIDRLPELRYRTRKRQGTVFVPHWTTDAYANWRQPCEDAGIDYVSPLLPGPEVLNRIAQSRLAIVESLHGAILADYYRVPWLPVASEGRVLAFKWLDFCMSLGLTFRPIRLPDTDAIERMIKRRSSNWSGELEYLPEAQESDYQGNGFATHRPVTITYRTKIKLKQAARPIRRASLAVLHAVRSSAPYRAGFADRSGRLAKLLSGIAEQPPFLSTDRVREEKLSQIDQMLDRLQRDFTAL